MKECYRKGISNHLAPSPALLPRGTQRSVDGGVGDRASKIGNPDTDDFVMLHGSEQTESVSAPKFLLSPA